MNEDGVGGAYDSHGVEEKFALFFGGKTWRKESTFKTRSRWENNINKIGNKEVGWKELRLYPCAHYVGVWGSGGLAPLDGVSF